MAGDSERARDPAGAVAATRRHGMANAMDARLQRTEPEDRRDGGIVVAASLVKRCCGSPVLVAGESTEL